MSVIAHLSDLHFGRIRPHVANALLDSLAQVQPDVIVVSGDLTQRARTAEYRAARAFLGQLRAPVLAVPGNHDLPAWNVLGRLTRPWRNWQRHIGPDLQPELQTDGCLLVGVLTARRGGWYLDWSRGRINDAQARHVAALARIQPPHRLRVVVAHHPFWVPDSSHHRDILGGGPAALAHFREAGIDLILGGHIHQRFVHLVSGMLVSHAGTTLSTRLPPGETNSYTLVRGDRSQLALDHMAWTDGGFNRVGTQHFARQTGGWQAGA